MRKPRPCNRCPTNKQQPATNTDTIAIGGSKFILQLCDGCYSKLNRDIYAWGMLGEQIEETGSRLAARLITEDYMDEARQAAQQRSEQREEQRQPRPAWAGPRSAMGMGLKSDADQWRFTQHALERMEQRRVAPLDVIRTATNPPLDGPGDRPGIRVYQGNGVKIVVDPKTKEILTVSSTETESREQA